MPLLNHSISRKKTHKVLHDKFGTVRRKMKVPAIKCSAETIVYQATQNMCKRVQYSLLNSRKWLHVSRTVCRHTDRYKVSHTADKCSWFYWTVKTGHLTQLILILWIIYFVALFSSWCIVGSLKTSTIWNKSWTVGGWWSAKN